MYQHQLPAGLTNANGEFFVDNGMPELLQNRAVTGFEGFQPTLIDSLEALMLQNKKRHSAIKKMVDGAGRIAEIAQYTHCMHGGFDCKPDIIDGVIQEPEYWKCPKRATCDFQGKVCIGLKDKYGNNFAKREIQYIKLTAMGFLDKMIAVELGISDKTVPSLSRKVRDKTGSDRKADITRFALDNNI